MILITYDIANDKLRTKFSKYLERYGHRIQYSVFEIDNSERVLKNIRAEISNNFEKRFTQEDSVIIYHILDRCTIERYGYAKNDEKEIIFVH